MGRYDDFPVSDEPVQNVRHSIEEDMKILVDIEGQISDLLRARNERLQNIKDSHYNYKERIQASEDWLEGYVKGNPIPDRNSEKSVGY